jgi:hypothetical protein
MKNSNMGGGKSLAIVALENQLKSLAAKFMAIKENIAETAVAKFVAKPSAAEAQNLLRIALIFTKKSRTEFAEQLGKAKKIYDLVVSKAKTGKTATVETTKLEKDPTTYPPYIIGEFFISIDTKADVTEYLFTSLTGAPYEDMGTTEKTIKADTRVYLLEDKGDVLYVCLAENKLERCTISKKNIWQTPKNSKDLISLGLEKDIQILDQFISAPDGKTIGIDIIKKNTIIEWSNTNIKLRTHLEQFIETIWNKLATSAKNLNVSATCSLRIPTDVVELLPPDEQAKYANEVGFNFTRIQIGKASNQILLVEELAATTEADMIMTEAEIVAAKAVKEKYNIIFDKSTAKTPMSENEQLQVLEALSMLPPAILKLTKGVKFQKYSEADIKAYMEKHDKEPLGLYDRVDNVIILSYKTLEKNTHLGLGTGDKYTDLKGKEKIDAYNNYLQYVVLHETGHLIDLRQWHINIENYHSQILGKISLEDTKRVEKGEEISFWRTETYANLIKNHGRKKIFISKYSGETVIFDNEAFTTGKADCFKDTDKNKPTSTSFLKAVKADGNEPTNYASTNNKEAFAECFALYFAFPSKLKDISPNVFKWFENEKF